MSWTTDTAHCYASAFPSRGSLRNGRATRLLATTLVVLALGGCVELQPRQHPAAAQDEPAPRADDLGGIVRYLNWLRKERPDQVERLRARAEGQLATGGTPFDHVRMAMLLSLPQAPEQDPERAQALLRGVVNAPGASDADLRAFARALLWDLENRKALRDKCERAVDEERDKRKTLEHQLQELKAIEEQLNRRDTAKAIPKP